MATLVARTDHPLAKKIRLVASRARRAPPDLVLAEGIRVLEEATRARLEIDAVLLDERFGARPREATLISTWSARGVPIQRAAARLMASLSDVTTPQGAVALVRVRRTSPDALAPLPGALVLCACGIQDPGNLGTLVRAAAAAAAAVVCATRGTASARNPKAVRASAGALFRIPVVEDLEPEQFLEFCRARKLRALRADPGSGTPCWEADLRRGTALVVGSEAHGFPDALWESIPAVSIPMAAGSESLNAAAAGAILLFEAVRQRAAAAGRLRGGTR